MRITLDGGISFDAKSLTIDGVPYVPPAPAPVKWWECEVECAGFGPKSWIASKEHELLGVKARATLGFSADGKVWFADERAKSLARWMREAADRLDGGER